MRRPERLAVALKEEIAEVVGFELEDPRLSSVTVTDVTVTDDLRDAKVFVLVNGSDDEIKKDSAGTAARRDLCSAASGHEFEHASRSAPLFCPGHGRGKCLEDR